MLSGRRFSCSVFWPGRFFHKSGDDVDGQEADKKRTELAREVGADGVLTAGESADADARDVLSRLLFAVQELAGMGDINELAFRGSGAERSDFHTEPGNFSSDTEREESVECLCGGVCGEISDRLKAGC